MRDAHPGINLVFDAVVIRRTKKQLAHTIPKSTRGSSSRRSFPRIAQIIGELPEKWFHVCDQADGLQRLMLDRSLYRGRIDIDADGFHSGRQHTCDRERMLKCR